MRPSCLGLHHWTEPIAPALPPCRHTSATPGTSAKLAPCHAAGRVRTWRPWQPLGRERGAHTGWWWSPACQQTNNTCATPFPALRHTYARTHTHAHTRTHAPLDHLLGQVPRLQLAPQRGQGPQGARNARLLQPRPVPLAALLAACSGDGVAQGACRGLSQGCWQQDAVALLTWPAQGLHTYICLQHTRRQQLLLGMHVRDVGSEGASV